MARSHTDMCEWTGHSTVAITNGFAVSFGDVGISRRYTQGEQDRA